MYSYKPYTAANKRTVQLLEVMSVYNLFTLRWHVTFDEMAALHILVNALLQPQS